MRTREEWRSNRRLKRTENAIRGLDHELQQFATAHGYGAESPLLLVPCPNGPSWCEGEIELSHRVLVGSPINGCAFELLSECSQFGRHDDLGERALYAAGMHSLHEPR